MSNLVSWRVPTTITALSRLRRPSAADVGEYRDSAELKQVSCGSSRQGRAISTRLNMGNWSRSSTGNRCVRISSVVNFTNLAGTLSVHGLAALTYLRHDCDYRRTWLPPHPTTNIKPSKTLTMTRTTVKKPNDRMTIQNLNPSCPPKSPPS